MMKFTTSVVMAFAVGAEAKKYKKSESSDAKMEAYKQGFSFLKEQAGYCDAECEKLCNDAKQLLIVVNVPTGFWTLENGTYLEKDGKPVDWTNYLVDERCGAGTLMIQYGSLATMGALIAIFFSF